MKTPQIRAKVPAISNRMDVQMDGETISGAEFSVLAILSHG